MMQTTINIATVIRPADFDYEKALVIIRDDGFEIQNRRRQVLAHVAGSPQVLDNGKRWTLTDGSGSVWEVQVMAGCGCGGTKEVPKG